jgi:SnoaL-like domain
MGAAVDTETTRRLQFEYWVALPEHDFERYFTDDVTWTDMDTGDVVSGAAEVREYILALHVKAFHYTPPEHARSFGVDGGYVYLESDFVATHIGEFDGVPPTGASVNLPFSLTYEWHEGKIRAMRFYMSMRELRRRIEQEGAPPVPGRP